MAKGKLVDLLRENFGYRNFREYQEEIVENMLEGKNVFATLPTGHGKSLCYQLPAVVNKNGLTIVISPLIALIRDQVARLSKLEISCAFLDSLQSDSEHERQFKKIKLGKVRLLYISPERLATESFYENMHRVEINRIVVDEAHCVSMWGHDFRPSYLKIPKARERLGNSPIAAFTATAPVCVRDDIIESLKIDNSVQIHADVDRPNLEFSREIFYSKYDKTARLFELLREAKSKRKLTIVYCARTKTAEELSEIAREEKIPNVIYHSKMEREDRISSQEKFIKGLVPVMFATKAFGMGIDKSDIRYLIHFEVPDSLEGYYQEAGRAGRDGKIAYCKLLYQYYDAHLQRGFVYGANPSVDFIHHIYYKLWNRAGNEEKYEKVPEIFFNRGLFLEEYGESSLVIQDKVRSSLAALEEHGLVLTQGNKMKFLMKPKDIEKESPIKEEIIRAKYDHDIQRLKIMLHYATADDEPRNMILRHFRHNTLVEEVKALDFKDFVKLDPEHVKLMMLALTESDYGKKYLSGLMKGVRKAKNPVAGSLEKLSTCEILTELDHTASNGLVRYVPIWKSTYVTLTEDGMEKLEEENITCVVPCSTYENLRKRMYNPHEKRTMKNAIKNWFNHEADWFTPESCWRSVESFLVTNFEVLNKRVSGRKLVADYMRVKDYKVGLKDTKKFLNYLFNDSIKY